MGKNLKPLSELESVDELSIEETRVTNSGLQNIAKLATLKSIRFVRSNITAAALAHFCDLSSLESLVVDDLQLSDADLSPLQKLTNLNSFNLGATQISDEGLKNLGKWLPKIKELKILSNRVTAAGIQALHKALPEAQIEIKPYDEASVVAARPQFVAENTLEADAILDRWKKRGAMIDTDRENPQIKVNFERGDFSDADFAERELVPNLSSLTLKDVPISDKGLSHLKSLPRLVALNLSGTRITDRSLAYLVNQKALDLLVLTRTNITNDGLKSVGKLTSLSSLWLDETSVTDEGLVHLRSLDLNDRDIEAVIFLNPKKVPVTLRVTLAQKPKVFERWTSRRSVTGTIKSQPRSVR